eukprot:SAG11_NODE_1087_length_5925_cov_2.708376_6_plen_115_part_00
MCAGKRPREELYDLKNDPGYLHNVATDPAYAEVRARLEQRLLTVLREEHDPRLIDVGGGQPCRYDTEEWYGSDGMGWLEPQNIPTSISYEEARRSMEAEMRRAMIPLSKRGPKL